MTSFVCDVKIQSLITIFSQKHFVNKDFTTYQLPTYKIPEQKKFNLDNTRIREIDVVIQIWYLKF